MLKNNNDLSLIMNDEKKKHNGIIAVWKFLFSMMVVLRHVEASDVYFQNFSYTFIAGSIAVDFFFIVSGYLMTKKAINKEIRNEELGKETFAYITKKLKGFFPYILTAIIFSIITRIFMNYNISKADLVNYIFDILMIPMLLIKHSRILGIEWYISAMILSMMILYPLILKYKKNFLYLVAPLLSLFILGFISRMDGSLAGVDIYYFGFIPKGLIRAIAVMCLGCLVYLIVEKVKRCNFTLFARIILTIMEIVGFSSIFYIVNIPGAHEKYGFIMLIIFVISISIAFSKKSLFLNMCNNRFFYYLEKISLPIYLNHMWVIDVLKFIFGDRKISYYVMSFNVICVTIAVSAILTFAMDKVLGNNTLKKGIKKLFLQDKLGEDKNVKEQI